MSAPRAGPSPDRLPSRSGQSGSARRPPGKHWFLALADATCAPSAAATLGVDRVLLHVASEDSVFARFNRSAVRQLTRVDQREATVSLVRGRRRIAATVDLGGDIDADIASLRALRDGLARDLALVPEDPHLRLPEVVVDTDRDDGDPGDAVYAATRQAPAATGASEGMDADGTTTTLRAVVDQVVTEARGLDFVGIHVDGPVVAAFADSRGQRNWHRVRQHQLDWSLFCQGDPATRGRAVKSRLAGRRWDADAFTRRMALARSRLALLERPPVPLAPGARRAWLEPAAVADMLGMLAWSGFGLKDRRTGTSALGMLVDGDAALSPLFRLTEATADGIAPLFTRTGQVKPDAVLLVDGGRDAGALVSPRSAAEFGVEANADESETPSSLALSAGTLDPAQAAALVGTGLVVGNLWYLNWSDRQRCRMTGMTRFACFRVEGGELLGPIEPMRFDDSFLRLFGESLVGLAGDAQAMPSDDTYGRRHLGSITAPSALLADMRFTS